MGPFTALTPKEFRERILALPQAVVLIHRSPDGDCVGSGAALCRFLLAHGIPASLGCSDPIPRRLAFLCEGIPLYDGGEARFIITADVASLALLGNLSPLVEKAERVFSVDHHALSTPFAPNCTMAGAAATGEVLYDIFTQEGEVPAPEIATALYAALSSDTGCFRFSNATPDTHRVAAALIATGIDAADINHRLFESKSEGQLRAEGYAALHIKTAFGGRLAYLAFDRSVFEKLSCEDEDFETAIDVVRSFGGAEVAAFLRERQDGTIRLSLRTTGADAAAFCARFGGGGHRRAAGCSFDGMTFAEARRVFLSAVGCLFEGTK